MLKALTIKDSEKFLRQISSYVDFTDKELKQNLKDITEYCLLNNGLYALACIQIGIPKRIVYIKSTKPNDTSANLNPILMINPEIISQKGKTEFWESCASGLTNFGLVERPYKIVVKYQDESGMEKNETFEGFSSTVISHEIDHLNGIFHMDRAKKILQMAPEKRFEFRKEHPYKIISKECEFKYPKINSENILIKKDAL